MLCIALDAAGDASLFISFGEVADLAFAAFSAFVIETFFDWPLLALFCFWEEALPGTDFVPSATIGWILVTTGGRQWLRLQRGLPSARGDPRARPLEDLASYDEAEPWLRPGNRPWKD